MVLPKSRAANLDTQFSSNCLTLLSPGTIGAIPRLDLLKVDVEGAEPLVFYGAKNTIKKHKPIILFEKNNQLITQSMITHMKLPKKVYMFEIMEYAISLGYTLMIDVWLEDYMLIPPHRKRILNDPLVQFRPINHIKNKYISTPKSMKIIKFIRPSYNTPKGGNSKKKSSKKKSSKKISSKKKSSKKPNNK